MKIVNAGNRIMNAWLYLASDGDPRRREFLRRLDEEPQICHDFRQRWLPACQLLY